MPLQNIILVVRLGGRAHYGDMVTLWIFGLVAIFLFHILQYGYSVMGLRFYGYLGRFILLQFSSRLGRRFEVFRPMDTELLRQTTRTYHGGYFTSQGVVTYCRLSRRFEIFRLRVTQVLRYKISSTARGLEFYIHTYSCRYGPPISGI